MHELPVAQSILKIALEHAEKANAKRIVDLNIVMGELSSIVDELDPVLLGYHCQRYHRGRRNITLPPRACRVAVHNLPREIPSHR